MRKTFSDETFSSLKVFKKKKNQSGLLVMKFFITRTFSDEAIVTKLVSSLKIHFVVVQSATVSISVFEEPI